jgi:hypothetical protein
LNRAVATRSLFLVARPNGLERWWDSVPANATELITDWEAHFEGLRLLRLFAAEEVRSADWLITDRVVEVDSIDTHLLREAASDHDIATIFGASTGYLRNPRVPNDGADDDRTTYARRISSLVQSESELGRPLLATPAIPILLGLIIIATVSPGVTYRAQEVWLEQNRQAPRSQRSEETEAEVEE